jgi:tellurium resistance protein TerZ
VGVNLTKGQTVSLVKQGGGALSQVRMGLGWDAIKKKGLFGGTKEVSVDLDASAILFAADKRVLDVVYYGNLPQVAHIVFVVSSYSGQNFSQIENAFARVVDTADRDKELVRYQLTGSGTHTAVIMARVSREGTGWTFTAIGNPGNARTADQLVPLAAQTI